MRACCQRCLKQYWQDSCPASVTVLKAMNGAVGMQTVSFEALWYKHLQLLPANRACLLCCLTFQVEDCNRAISGLSVAGCKMFL